MKTRILSLTAAAFLVFLSGPAFGAGTSILSGTVGDVAGGLVTNAKVTLTTPTGDSRETATDGEGRFRFAELDPGSYFLRVEADGHFPAGRIVTVSATELNAVMVLMDPRGDWVTVSPVQAPPTIPPAPPTISPTPLPEGQEIVTVVAEAPVQAPPMTPPAPPTISPTPLPESGETVTVVSEAPVQPPPTTPPAPPTISPTPLHEGQETVTVVSEAPVQAPPTTPPAPPTINPTPLPESGETVTVSAAPVQAPPTTPPTPATEIPTPVLERQEAVMVTGFVRSSAAEPLAGAAVTLTTSAGESRETVTDEEGRFQFAEVEPSPYFLRVEADGHFPGSWMLTVAAKPVDLLSIKMVPVTPPEAAASGAPPMVTDSVQNAGTEPLAETAVAATPVDPVETDIEAPVVEEVPDGAVKEKSTDSAPPASPTPPPALLEPVTVGGVVEDVSGGPLPGAQVTLYSVSGEEREAVSGDDGGFAFEEVDPGEYVLRVVAKTRQPVEIPVSATTRAPKPLKIEMMLGMAEEVSVTGIMPDEERTASAGNADMLDLDDEFLLGMPLPATGQDVVDYVGTLLSPAAAGTAGVEILVDDAPTDSLALPASAIDHIRFNRDPYSPKYRRPGKARLEIEAQDGSRTRFHGGVGIFTRNSAFESKNALASTKPNVDRRFFEANFSGPIGRRAGSFFLGMERQMIDEEALVNAQTLEGPLNFNVPAKDVYTSAIAHLYLYFGLNKLKILYQFNRESLENRGIGGFALLEQGINSSEEEHAIQISAKNVVSLSFVNDFRFKIGTETASEGRLATDPAIDVSGAFTGGPNQSFRVQDSLRVEAREVGTYVGGTHTVRFGGGFTRRSIDEIEGSDFGGTFEFAGLDDYALAKPYVYRVNQGDPTLAYSLHEVEAFIQDEMRLGNSLRLMAGARYDWQSALRSYKNIAPRVAFAFAPGSQQTVLRGGAGLFYEQLPTRAIGRSLLYDGEQLVTLVVTDPSYPDPFLAGTAAVVPPSIFRLAPDLEAPYLFQNTLGVEHYFGDGSGLTFEYTYLRGDNLFRVRDVNAPLPGGSVRPDPALGNILQLESVGKLRSHAFSVTYRALLSEIFRMMAQYTIGTAENDFSGEAGGRFSYEVPADSYDLDAEWGRADFDRRHRFNATTVALLPHGFSLGATVAFLSPEPFDITTGNDENGDGYAKDRPEGVTRNTGQGPDFFRVDLRLSKAWSAFHPIRRGELRDGQVQLVIDAFNLTNRTNYAPYIGVIGSPFFGRANAANAGRSIQLALKYAF